MIGFNHNRFISHRKGANQHVYPKRYTEASKECFSLLQARHRARPLVLLYHPGIHHPLLIVHLFKRFALPEYPVRGQPQQTSLLHLYKGVKSTLDSSVRRFDLLDTPSQFAIPGYLPPHPLYNTAVRTESRDIEFPADLLQIVSPQ
jgi:hypothetical protein